MTGKCIPAYFIDRKSSTTFLFSHGNAEDIRMTHEWGIKFSKELNVNLFAYEYEGYGETAGMAGPGRASESGCYDAIDAAYSHLTDHLLVKSEQLVLFGRSLGSGPSCYLAERLSRDNVRLGGLALQCPILSIFRVAFNFRFTMPGDMFCNVDRIPHITCPVFIIHGTNDEIVPFWNGEELFSRVQKPYRVRPLWVQDGGHNNLESLLEPDDIFYCEFREFLKGWLPCYQDFHNNFEESMIKTNSKY